MKYQVVDVRQIQGNFYSGLMKTAENVKVGEGLEVIQTFEPIPLYAPMEQIGFTYHTEKVSETEYHTYFERQNAVENDGSMSFRPTAITNYPLIDEQLGDIVVNFWDLTWNSDRRYLPYETRLLLSLTNAVGAGRMRQATRELVKVYVHGLDVRALDDVFELIVWNQGIGNFSSEIGPSPLFKAYKLIKTHEKNGVEREVIINKLLEKFGEKNPDIQV